MYHFTAFKVPRSLEIAPVLRDGGLGGDLPKHHILFLSAETIVSERDGKTFLFHVQEITRENDACMVGYCVEGEDEL